MSTHPTSEPDPTTATVHPKIKKCNGERNELHIVMLKSGVAPLKLINELKLNYPTVTITHEYKIINAFAGSGFDERSLAMLCESADVELIQEDGFAKRAVQDDAPWGLNRLSAADHTPNGELDVNSSAFLYHYDDPQADAPVVNIYVMDDGVRTTHNEFTDGRATWLPGTPIDDQVLGGSHGTQVAAIAAGTRWGVAKTAHIIAVKLKYEYGPNNDSVKQADVMTAFELVKAHAHDSEGSSILNFSSSGPANEPLDIAVKTLTDAKIHFVACAGNYNAHSNPNYGINAGDCSPGRCDTVICVGASDFNNFIWEEYEDGMKVAGSKYGSAVTVFAPGVNITTADSTGDAAIAGPHLLCGTSFAAPYVSGLIAYLISIGHMNDTPAQMKQRIVDMARNNALNPYHIPAHTTRKLACNRFQHEDD